jgi:hypothetical protein
MSSPPTRFAGLRRWQVGALAAGILAILVYGLWLTSGGGTTYVPLVSEDHEKSGADLKYYRQVVAEVHAGANYYDVADRELRRWGFRVGSIFNWRLPTYAYVLGALPGPDWVRGVLVAIGLAGLILAGIAETREANLIVAGCTVCLLLGVFVWSIHGDAYFAQEVWAGMLIMLSVAAHGLRWRALAVASGLAALFFRELALPYCLIAGLLAVWHGRRRESLAWFSGVLLFAAYLGWHAMQVTARLTPKDLAGSRGVLEWFQYGGLTFDIMTTRMNAFLLDAPGWLVFAYLLLGLIGLIGWRSEQGALLALTTLAYLAAFSVIGLPMNMNWGLMFAPLLPFGVVRTPGTLLELGRQLRGTAAPLWCPAPVDVKIEANKDLNQPGTEQYDTIQTPSGEK